VAKKKTLSDKDAQEGLWSVTGLTSEGGRPEFDGPKVNCSGKIKPRELNVLFWGFFKEKSPSS